MFKDKLATLSLTQKIALLSGADFWRTTAIPEAGIPQIKVTDGPNGARGDLAAHVPAACFPVGVALGATWNTALLAEIGKALGEETKTKAAHVLLGPTINLQRTPVGGRNFECYSEDPYLTGELAVSYVDALQATGIGACPKHFVGNDTEHERMTISSDIDERTLREVYLAPFEQTVKRAAPWTIMAAYNRINATYACSHRALLVDMLKTEWGFNGVVISDWFAARETVENANGGLDLEMPGPSRIWGAELASAAENGNVDEAEIDDKVSRILALIDRTGVRDNEPIAAEQGIDNAQHRELIRRAGAEAMVLLKNTAGRLPLSKSETRSLAIIGPNAELGQIMGGGSSFVNSHRPVHPLEGLQAAFPGANTRFETGCTNYKYLPPFHPGTYATPAGESGHFLREYFDNEGFAGTPAKRDTIASSRITMLEGVASDGPSANYMRLSAQFTPTTSGAHELGVFSAGQARIRLDGEIIVDNWEAPVPGTSFFGFGSEERRASITLDAGRTYDLAIEYAAPGAAFIAGVQFGIAPEPAADAIVRAAEAAATSDEAVLILGSNADWESEGHDREHMGLPGDQDALAEAVLAANPDTIIVMNIGSATNMPWYDKARTVLVCWFPGEEMGNALGDVISGAAEPSGRLPFSWPKRIEDHPAYSSYPGENGDMPYTERLLVGHRWYDKNDIEPLAAFGAGLGYGHVSIESAERPPGGLTVALRNTSSHDTLTTVQVYAETQAASAEEPIRRLVGFAKIPVGRGETISGHVPIGADAMRLWSEETQSWQQAEGVTLCAGLSSAGPFHRLPA